MGDLRDYQSWHQNYDDPASGLSWRLAVVQRYLSQALDRQPGPVRVLSLCSGNGRDVIGVLAGRPDADRVIATLVELHPEIVTSARNAATAAGLSRVEVRQADAGNTDACADAAPADVVLLVGIFGNISDAVRAWFADAGFTELDYAVWEPATPTSGAAKIKVQPALGAMRYDGEPVSLIPGRQRFSFMR